MPLKITIVLSLFLVYFVSIAQPPSIESMELARDHFNKGVKYGIEYDYKHAVEEFDKAIALNPLFAEAFLYKGLAEIELHDYQQALKDLTITIELDPAFSDQAHYFRGVAKSALKDYAGAIDDLTVAIRMNPDFVAFYQRGKANLELKEFRRSLQDFEISLRLNPDFHEGYLYRGINLYYMEQYEDARDDIEIAKKHLPNNAKAFYYSGLIRTRIQNSYVAIEDLNKAIELDPSFVSAYEARATASLNTGNHQMAEEDHRLARKVQEEKKQGKHLAKNISNNEIPEDTKQGGGESNISPSAATDINFEALFLKQEQEQKNTIAQSNQHQDREANYTTGSTAKAERVPIITEMNSGIYNNDLEPLIPGGFGVQVASYSNTENLLSLTAAYQERYNRPVYINVSSVNGRTLYKLIMGQFSSRTSAEEFRDMLRNESFPDSFLVVYDNL